MKATVSKLETVATDINQVASQANQDAIDIEKIGNNEYKIIVNEELNSFTSTNPSQGIGKWICLVVNTGEDDITKVKYNGIAFTLNDVLEADTVGVEAGSFVWWVKYDALPKQMTLSADGKADTTIKISK